METPKQMGSGSADQVRQRHQGDTSETEVRREPQASRQLAETADEQMRPKHFSDWASI